MPFIVTAMRPKARADAPPDFDISRRAVATLEEAKRRLAGRIEKLASLTIEQAAKLTEQIASLPDSGGSVGPLPDGTVIEVEAIGQQRMRSDLRAWGSKLDTIRSTDDVITDAWVDAFNAREER